VRTCRAAMPRRCYSCQPGLERDEIGDAQTAPGAYRPGWARSRVKRTRLDVDVLPALSVARTVSR